MDNEPIMTLQCVTKDGEREPAKLAHQTLAEARDLAQWVLHAGNGLYTEVEICDEAGIIETIQNPLWLSEVGTT